MTIRSRISLLCTALATVLLLTLGGLWLAQTRLAIHEEIEAANRVARQWLAALDRSPLAADDAVALLRQVGRVRANDLEAFDRRGQLRYRAPAPRYKAGRQAPAWFAALVQPPFAAVELPLAGLTVRLSPDASRATLDAWDDLCAMAGWAAAMLALLFLATRYALNRTLQPLTEVMAALDRTGQGCFATRLPLYPVAELQKLAHSFNAMNDRLDEAIRDNVQLQSQQAVAAALNGHLEEERKAIARELHDELSQGITAVRALAGAIAHKGRDDSTLHGAAQSILAVAGEMQQGIKAILQRLRPPLQGDELEQAIEGHLLQWQDRHPQSRVHLSLDPAALAGLAKLTPAHSHTLLRTVQEGLTNAARHAQASNIWIRLGREADGLHLDIRDDGCGPQPASTQAGCGLGLAGLRERLELLGGALSLAAAAEGGMLLRAHLPAADSPNEVCSTPCERAEP